MPFSLRQQWLRACNIGGCTPFSWPWLVFGVLENQVWRSAPLAVANLTMSRRVPGERALNAIRVPRSAALKRREDRKRKREEEDRKAEEAKKSKTAEGTGDQSAPAKAEGLKEDSKRAASAADPEAPAEQVWRLASMKRVCAQQLRTSSSQVFPSSVLLARYRLMLAAGCTQLLSMDRTRTVKSELMCIGIDTQRAGHCRTWT